MAHQSKKKDSSHKLKSLGFFGVLHSSVQSLRRRRVFQAPAEKGGNGTQRFLVAIQSDPGSPAPGILRSQPTGEKNTHQTHTSVITFL